MSLVPVIEVGGTHVTAALVEMGAPRLAVVGECHRRTLRATGSANELIDAFVDAASQLRVRTPTTWGVAMPGPFDYERGIGRFEDVGKFDSLNGVDVGEALSRRLPWTDGAFVNDATAYGMGQVELGATGAARRVLVLTLGTGVGSVFLVDGLPVTSGPGVPPHGWVYLLEHDGRPLEDHMSRRALLRDYRSGGGCACDDVAQIAAAARHGSPLAERTLRGALAALADALAPVVADFGAEAVVVGGAIAGSFDLLERWLAPHLGMGIRPAIEPDAAPLLGAARWVLESQHRRRSG